ncbi:GNAT family N-acetyltransferase [Clostridium senegalense]|uniref:GNAT family N-acetyltransferase n=1 Tax=Clostridium senegalense TaxID=1465809 RepID=A0A6M0H0D6_9CLOT|nr:GNAT family N-acetyltransferase [Clostridium senegalense]NEU04250.1 GNAT family N-acetyltransferase [Clostridium senegalense]
MSFIIRKATKNDYLEVNALMSELHSLHVDGRPDIYVKVDSPLVKDYYNILLESGLYEVFVLEEDESILVGYTILEIKESSSRMEFVEKKFVYMNDLCIKKEYRGNGLGKILFNVAVEFAKKVNGETLELGVWNFNESAIKFYKHMGMSVRNIRMELKL